MSLLGGVGLAVDWVFVNSGNRALRHRLVHLGLMLRRLILVLSRLPVLLGDGLRVWLLLDSGENSCQVEAAVR